jgi:hypothetical protein
MSDTTLEVGFEDGEAFVEDKTQSFLVALTWTVATFALGLGLVMLIWLGMEELPDNFFWDLITG